MVTARGTAGVSVEIGPIDIDILNKQYIQLIKLIEHDEDHELWGLVYMIGDILHESNIEGWRGRDNTNKTITKTHKKSWDFENIRAYLL